MKMIYCHVFRIVGVQGIWFLVVCFGKSFFLITGLEYPEVLLFISLSIIKKTLKIR